MRPPPRMAFDFTGPADEPALAPAHGFSWRVFPNPVFLLVGGVPQSYRDIDFSLMPERSTLNPEAEYSAPSS